MVFLVLTRAGLAALHARIDPSSNAVWVDAGVLSDAELAELRRNGWSLTNFSHPLDRTDLSDDVDTIREHHPDQVIWVEASDV